MSENGMILLRDDAHRNVAITPDAIAMRDDALAAAALVGKVTNADEQAHAVEAQKELKRVLNLTEKSRKEVKAPVIDFGRDIDQMAKKFAAEVKEEFDRVSHQVADYQATEAQKARAEQAARSEELTALEREREEAISQADSQDEIWRIQEEFNIRAQKEGFAPDRIKGQLVREQWRVEIMDVYALARAHPNCVKITPMIGEIKQLLDMGIHVAGVRATKETKASVRVA